MTTRLTIRLTNIQQALQTRRRPQLGYYAETEDSCDSDSVYAPSHTSGCDSPVPSCVSDEPLWLPNDGLGFSNNINDTQTPPPAPHRQFFNARPYTTTVPNRSSLGLSQQHSPLQSTGDTHQREIRALHREWQMPSWKLLLEENFSVCLYGYGSKRSLLLDFVEQHYDHLPVLIIHG